LINIVGLSIGISCTIILFLMVHFTNTTDRFHKNYNNIFLFQQKVVFDSGEYTADRGGGATGPAMAEAYPQIQTFTRMGQLSEMLLMYFPEGKEDSADPISFVEQNGAAVDSTFFDVFSFEFVKGSPAKRINQNNFIYLTETLSNKYFNEVNPIGETIYFQEGLELTVTGILKDVPNNSSVQFSYLVPFEVMALIGKPIDGYGGDMFYTYFILNDPKSADIINSNINEFLESRYEETLEVDRFLSHIREVYLYGETKAFWGILIFGIIGLSILLIASINYVNLSTAKSIDRAKEVGIRKTGGAGRWQLVRQFLAESLLTTLAAVNLAILMTELILPHFNNSFQAQLAIPYQTLSFWIFIIALVLGVGILAGFYPAFMLSSFKPSLILKNFQGGKSRGARLRKVLVVAQFSITIFFIICTIFLYRQVSYVDTADLGIDKENVIYIPTRGKLWDKFDEVKGEILNESYVKQVTSSSELPNYVTHGEIDWGKEKEKQNAIARMMWCSEDMLETFGLELSSGRFYDKNRQSDLDDGIIVNEEIIKMLNYEGDPIGQRFRFWDNEKTIIGVVKNFTFFPINIGSKAII
ncbi:MAG: ABC transporter permease, partial [Cyclobacteriaceae bacterium]|nr:ABC transporter permease [Cyclobacteriaceae bacterium]